MELAARNVARQCRPAHALAVCIVMLVMATSLSAVAATNWVTTWGASPQGPYPSGAAVAQPDLSFAFPNNVAVDQTFRLIVRPGMWSKTMRIHFTNLFGNQPLTIDGIYVGLQKTGAAIVTGTNQPVSVNGRSSFTLQPGQSTWSDPMNLQFVQGSGDDQGDQNNQGNDNGQGNDSNTASGMVGRKLAISFHTVGTTGPMTWHAKAMTTSYVTNQGAGSVGSTEGDVFPTSTTSWYFIDKIDMDLPKGTQLVVALGDSITDGTSSTINGDDRWPDVLARRLQAAYGTKLLLVNEGIGGNQIVGPAVYDPTHPVAGGPSAVERLSRDVIGLSGVTAVIWHEGTNDVSAGTSSAAIEAGFVTVVQQLRAAIPGVRIVGTTITSEVGAAGNGGTPAAAAQRIALNQYIKSSGLFDDVVDFYAVTTDPATGALKAQFVPNTSIGGAGDHVHPNRAGYLTMGNAVNLGVLVH